MNTTIPNVSVPEGVSGNWRIERFSVTEQDVRLHNMRCSFSAGMSRRTIKAGTYTRLMFGREVVMSDTDAEKHDHWSAVHHANGIVLINGLGIGMVLNACMLKEEVERAIVVEKSPDVIALVAPHYHSLFGERVQIINADALQFRPAPKSRFGMVWHDIWNNLCEDNLDDMKLLHRRYGRKADWQGSWGRELISR